MRSDGVVVSPTLLDDDLNLAERVEDLAIEKFIPEAGIDAFAVSILLGRARFDEGCLGANSCNPVPDLLSNELRAVAPAEGRLGEPPRRQCA